MNNHTQPINYPYDHREYMKHYNLQNKEKLAKQISEASKKRRQQYGSPKYDPIKYQENKAMHKAAIDRYREKNLDKVKAYQKKYNDSKKEKRAIDRKLKYKANRETILAKHKEFRIKNKDKRNKKISDRRKLDPNFRLENNLRVRLYTALKAQDVKKIKSACCLTGCTVEQLKKHIEQQWLPGMSWDNYSLYIWHIDHIKPINTFDLTILEQQKQCFHYTNLRPLWATDNLSRPKNGSDV